MSYREINRASEGLDAVLKDIFKLEDEQVWRISEAVQDLATALADQAIDRLFNRGDYGS